MTKKFIAALLLSCLFCFNCKKGNTGVIDVSKITEADVLGNSTGQQDNTDWTLDNHWSIAENNLFQAPSADQLLNTETSANTSVFGFPNPVGAAMIFYAHTSGSTLAELVITDNMLSVKDRYFFKTGANGSSSQINFDASKYSNNTNYRLYYGFYSSTAALYFKGHGDLRIHR